MSTGKEEWLQRYLDGELSDKEEQQALHLIADDPEMRAILKFDLLLRQDLATNFRTGQSLDADPDSIQAFNAANAGREIPIPESFFDGVMNALSQRDDPYAVTTSQDPAVAAHKAGPSAAESDRVSIWDRIWQPRPVMWRPVWSAGIACALLLLVMVSSLIIPSVDEPFATLDIPAREIVEETPDRVMMRFVYVGSDAETVAVAGDFSDWEPITLTRQHINGDVAWTGIIPLPRGEHRYMFIKDGVQWATDPLANRFIDDGFGNKNAIVSL